MTRWKGLRGSGRASTGRWARRRWPKRPWGPTRPIGGKKGTKRHLLVDGRGVPLSLIVTAANVNDGKRLDAVLSAIVVKRSVPPQRRNKHLCADAGYRSADERWEVAVFGRNITDEEIVLGGIDFNNLTGMTNDPRTIGVEFVGRF